MKPVMSNPSAFEVDAAICGATGGFIGKRGVTVVVGGLAVPPPAAPAVPAPTASMAAIDSAVTLTERKAAERVFFFLPTSDSTLVIMFIYRPCYQDLPKAGSTPHKWPLSGATPR